jgi:uncharacterized membrane protein HdeD (DUF308 family)
MNNIEWGIVSLIAGIFFIWFTKRYPEHKPDIWKLDFEGYAGGAICIIVGVVLIYKGVSHR